MIKLLLPSLNVNIYIYIYILLKFFLSVASCLKPDLHLYIYIFLSVTYINFCINRNGLCGLKCNNDHTIRRAIISFFPVTYSKGKIKATALEIIKPFKVWISHLYFKSNDIQKSVFYFKEFSVRTVKNYSSFCDWIELLSRLYQTCPTISFHFRRNQRFVFC